MAVQKAINANSVKNGTIVSGTASFSTFVYNNDSVIQGGDDIDVTVTSTKTDDVGQAPRYYTGDTIN